MDFEQDYYHMFQTPSSEKVPFYMTYPMRNSFLEEVEYDKDCKRLQELYPREARTIQTMVERECDKMEYEGSMMFDEYPDRLLFRLRCKKIYEEMREQENAEIEGQSGDDSLMLLIQVMLMQEVYRRRCRYRRCHRWY